MSSHAYRNCCHARGCHTKGCLFHICRVCGHTDSNHRSSNCPTLFTSQRYVPVFHAMQFTPIQPLPIQPHIRFVQPVIVQPSITCGIPGCMKHHRQHECFICKNPNSNHRARMCPLRNIPNCYLYYDTLSVRRYATTDAHGRVIFFDHNHGYLDTVTAIRRASFLQGRVLYTMV